MKTNKFALAIAAIGLGLCLLWAGVQQYMLGETSKEDLQLQPLSTPASRGTAITGTVTSWPNRPGPSDPKDVPTSVPYAEITVYDLNGKVIATGKANKFGVYKIFVPSGNYKVKARFPNQTRPFPYPAVGQVTVPQNDWGKLDLQLDTGMR